MTSHSEDPVDVRQVVRAEGGFAYGVIGADIHVVGDGTPLYLLEKWRPTQLPDPQFLRELPSRMLNARFAVVRFTGREEELADLRRWRDGQPRLAVRWLHAPGGQGKTRLANQLAHESLAMGWKVVTAMRGPGTVMPPPGSQDLRLDGVAGLLMIVDYADRWPLTHLTWLMSNSLLYRPEVHTRVLMLARSADAWPAVRATLANEQIDTSTLHLGELPDGTGQRAEMFHAARSRFAAVYDVEDGLHLRPPVPLEHPDMGLSLALHIGALVAVDAHVNGLRPPEDKAALTMYLLDREHAHWARLYGGNGDGAYSTPPAVMNRTVFTAAITGTLPRSAGASVLTALDPAADVERILDDHAVCYPPADPGRDTVLEPLYPDRLAEDFLALTLPGHTADYPAQPWASGIMTSLLARAEGAPGSWNPRGLTLLISATHRWPHAGTGHLFPLLHGDPRLAVDGGNAVLAGMAALPNIPPDLLQEVAECFPPDIPPDLAVGCATVKVRLAPHRLAQIDDPAAQALIHLQLGNDLSQLGRGGEALRATRRGVEILRGLVQTAAGSSRIEYEMRLAQALNNLSSQLEARNEQARAIGAALEAVDINRRLVQADPGGTHRFHLAVTLATLGGQLLSAEQPADAYVIFRQSADIYRELAPADPEAESGLAVALTNLGAVLSNAGVLREAFELIREATVIWRRKAASDPEVHQSSLVTSSIRMADLSRRLGRPHEGLQATTEATAIARRLASVHPVGYRGSLTRSLEVHRDILLDIGQLPRALNAAQEVVEIRRRSFAATSTTKDAAALIYALRALGAVLAAAGRDDLARAANSEAVDLERLIDRFMNQVGLPPPLAPPTAIKQRMQRSTADAPRQVEDARVEPPPIAWRTAREIHRAGQRLARAQDWPAMWELVCSVPIADACRLTAMLPSKRWTPPDEAGRALVRALAAMDHRHAARVAKACAGNEKRALPGLLFTGEQASFAPNRAALTITTLFSDTHEETIALHDLSRSASTDVYRGLSHHGSISCLGADEVVAIRPYDQHTGTLASLVRYTRHATGVLLPGPGLTGARVVATVAGVAVGLDLAPVAYLGVDEEPLRLVDLSPLGLWRGSLMTVDPTANRIAISDGSRVAITDSRLRQITATADPPTGFGELHDLVFASPNELLISGTEGNLCLWRIDDARLQPVTIAATPRLDHLFSIPAWGVVGGWAHGHGRPFFHQSATLAPAGPPRPMGDGIHLHAIVASPDGRYVLYSGGESAADALMQWRPVLHDLHAPSAWIHRPMISIASADLLSLRTLLSAPSALGDLLPLLDLVYTATAYRLGVR